MNVEYRSQVRKLVGRMVLVILTAGFLHAETITFTNPGPLTRFLWKNDTIEEITWKADFPLTGNVRIELRNESSTTTVLTIVPHAPNSGYFRWHIPANLATERRRFRITFLSGGQSADSMPILIYPYMRLTSPPPFPAQTNWMRGRTYTISWTWTGPDPEWMKLNARTYGPQTDHFIASVTPHQGSYSWKVPHDFPLGRCDIGHKIPAFIGELLSAVYIVPGLVKMTAPAPKK